MLKITQRYSWQNWTLVLAGFYNILWGSWVILAPEKSFTVFGMTPPNFLEIWQCVGMIVGVYGVGYLIASLNPYRHWPIIFVGLLGKVLGPIGFIGALQKQIFPLSFGINIIFNDLIWWIPFGVILYQAFNSSNIKEMTHLSIEDLQNFEDRYRARFINSLSGFKSANLIGTIDEKGGTNLSIISSAFHLGANPALLGFIIRPDVSPRHTLNNIRSNHYCTLNHVHKNIIEKAHQTSARYPEEQSEFQACGLEEEFLNNFKAPFVKESRLKIALEVIREEKIEENGTHLIIARISDVHLPKNAIRVDGSIDIEKTGSLCVSGLDSYHETLSLGRLSYAKTNKKSLWL